MLEYIQPFTQQLRLDARKKAIKVIEALAGEKPQRESSKETAQILA